MRTLSDAQIDRLEAAADANDPARYYELLAEYGFGYGLIAREVVTNSGTYGRVANNFMREKLKERGMELTDDLRRRLIIELMRADLQYRRQDDVTVDHIAEYHEKIFERLGIPREAWTGAFLADRGALAAFCPTCTDAELAGHSRWAAPLEGWGDAIDDLTGEVFDFGSGPSEGAARDLLRWWRDLADPDVGPKALFDRAIEEPWWEPFIDWHPAYRFYKRRAQDSSTERRGHASAERAKTDPWSEGVSQVSPTEQLVRLSIAPGETKTATVRLPGLTVELQFSFPG